MKKKRKRNSPEDSPPKEKSGEVAVESEGNSQNQRELPSSSRLEQIQEKLQKEEMPSQEELFHYCILLAEENRKLSQQIQTFEENFKTTEQLFGEMKEGISNSTKIIQDLRENNNRLSNIEEEKKTIQNECQQLETENESLKIEAIRSQAHATRLSVRIKNFPYHQNAIDKCESQEESEYQFKQLLSKMNCENLKYKSIQRLKYQTGTSAPKKIPSLKVTFLSFEDKKYFFRNLYLLKKTNMNLEISQEFPRVLSNDLKAKNIECYEIRKKNFKTRLVLRNYEIKIQIRKKDSKMWYTYDTSAPDIVYKIPVPKQQIPK